MRLNFATIKNCLNALVLCAILVIAYNNWQDFFRVFKLINLQLFLLFLGLNFLGSLLASYRWSLLFKGVIDLRYLKFLKIFLQSIPYKLFGLGFVTGDVYRFTEVSTKEEVSITDSAGVVVIDRVLSLMGLIIVAASVGFYSFSELYLGRALVLLGFLAFLGIGVLLYLKKTISHKSIRIFKKEISFNFLGFLTKKKIFFGLLISMLGHSLALYSFFILARPTLSEAWSFYQFFPVGAALFVTEAIPVYGSAHFSSELIFSYLGIKNGIYIFNDYFLSLKIYQIMISTFLLPSFFKVRRQKSE